MSIQTYTGTLTIIECANCHVHFGVTESFEKRRRADHKAFYAGGES